MAIFHPIINIEISKGYCMRKYNNEKFDEISKRLRELSEDKTHWSDKVIAEMHNIIDAKTYDIPYDLVEPHYNTMQATTMTMDRNSYKKFETADSKTLKKLIADQMDNSKERMSTIQEVYLYSNPKYSEMDDIRLAHTILLLSEIAKNSNKLWVSVTMRIKELKNYILYFVSDDGHVRLSEKCRDHKLSGIQDYIDSMNELIDGKREVPYRS